MKPVRQMLHIPADPSGQRSILVVLVHRGQIAPLRISAGDLCDARFEVDMEPLPLQEEEAGAYRRPHSTPAWEDSWRGKDRKSTRLNSSHTVISYAVFCLKKKKKKNNNTHKQLDNRRRDS